MKSQQLRLFEPPEPRRSQRGAELVEFALIFPVLMMFVIAALGLLWVGFIKVAAAQTAKEAARHASVPVPCGSDLGPPLVETTLPVTVPTLPSTTVPTLPVTVPTLPSTTLTIPSTTLTIPPTTIPSLTTTIPSVTTSIPSVSTTIPSISTTSTVAVPSSTTSTTVGCTADFRTYPRTDNQPYFLDKLNGRFPAFNVGAPDINVVYTYNDASCPSGKHTPPGNVPETDCPTPAPNDPPSNARVDVVVTKQLPAPLRFFAGVFDLGDTIHAHAGGDTRGE